MPASFAPPSFAARCLSPIVLTLATLAPVAFAFLQADPPPGAPSAAACDESVPDVNLRDNRE